MSNTEIKSNKSTYLVKNKVGITDWYTLFFCLDKNTEKMCLLQISTEKKTNSHLDRSAYILKEMKRLSIEIEADYDKVKTDVMNQLNYDLSFPELIDSFICKEQGGRRINILAFKNVSDARNMVPLINITRKDFLRIDLRTSVWIMGKILKLFVLTHSENVSINSLPSSNILIEPKEHYVLVFDWAQAKIHNSKIDMEIRQNEIASVAKAVIIALGGDLENQHIPDDGEEGFALYTDYLWRLAKGAEANADRAHINFYELVDKIWKRGYYPFTTKPL